MSDINKSSIDELLLGGSNAQHPMPTEEKAVESLDIPEEENYTDRPEHDDDNFTLDVPDDMEPEDDPDYDPRDSDSNEEPERDEYGNEKERMSKGMKDRLDRKEKQYQREVEQRDREIHELRAQLANQGASREVQQAAQDFEYDPNATGDWQQQLAQFVRQEVSSMTRENIEKEERNRDLEAQRVFEDKFRDGMSRFDDFNDVITNLGFEITNPMTLATRGMDNPAAFLYAAAKRNPQELERISKMRDPYAQITEMGKLEERMRKNKPVTKAPRPLGKISEDATDKVKAKDKVSSGDDLLAKADAKRLNTVKARLRNNR